ncbi:MAG TPA: shikimate dehydrogenase [bacterium]|nr:shikimate dehydrogenase [bacterium]
MAEPYCVIGDPIAHSISPPIHQAVFRLLGIDADYEAMRVRPGELEDFMVRARRSGRPGWNVTIPHKETIIPFLDEIDPSARNIGAVNTVKNRNGGLIGYNTDVSGCMAALTRAGFQSKGKAVIFGAGGAARAGIEAIARLGLTECILFDVVPEKAENLRNHFFHLQRMDIRVVSRAPEIAGEIESASLILNASPAGMHPDIEVTPLPCPERIPGGATVFDMVYAPLETRLIREATARGAQTVSGLVMLVAQALEADAIFLDRDLPETLFEPVFRVALDATSHP